MQLDSKVEVGAGGDRVSFPQVLGDSSRVARCLIGPGRCDAKPGLLYWALEQTLAHPSRRRQVVYKVMGFGIQSQLGHFVIM